VTAAPAGFAIQWNPDPAATNRMVVQVSGLDAPGLRRLGELRWERAEWERLFAVFVRQENLAAEIGLPPVFGSYSISPEGIRFDPAFPLAPGVRYRALFHPDRLPGQAGAPSEPVVSDFRVPPRPSTPATVVRQIYPTSRVLPENLLKFYLEFSGPMSRGHSYDHIHLRDQEGKDVELPFLEIDEELWNPAMTRLTLFIDPGRIKRGVQPLEEIGPALENGRNYTLVIDADWRDAAGVRLQRPFEKTFQVGPSDREPPDPADWKIRPPRPGGVEPLTIVFPEPMDQALSRRVIRVFDPSGASLNGDVELSDEERRWEFRPLQSWKPGAHALSVQTTIEDLAGNNIGKPFEVDVFEGVQRRFTNAVVKVPFEIR